MTKAVYRKREDGDYDFVAAFETEQLPDAPSNWPEEIAEWMRSEGDEVIITDQVPLCHLPDVLEMQPNAGTANEKADA